MRKKYFIGRKKIRRRLNTGQHLTGKVKGPDRNSGGEEVIPNFPDPVLRVEV